MCANASMINITDISVYPGETFSLSAVLVGGDFGITPGTVTASINFPYSDSVSFASKSMEEQLITSKECTNLEYSIMFLNQNTTPLESLVLSFTAIGTTLKEVPNNIEELCTNFTDFGVIDLQLISTPIVMHVTLCPCPLGFTLVGSDSGLYRCDCYPVIKDLASVSQCSIHNGMGYVSLNSNVWISLVENPSGHENGDDSKSGGFVIVGNFCRRCKKAPLNFSFELGSDFLCSDNHARTLCGGCTEGYSLRLGTSDCQKCSNAYQVLWIVFIAAGPLFVLVISLLNLTVTQGKINGLIFYANVIWAHQGILFPQGLDKAHNIFVPILFWLNLDFGISTCFIHGLTAFGKSWLQYVFPIYIAILFFIGVRFSSKLSKVFGDRTVPTLATLFFCHMQSFFVHVLPP